MSAPRSGIVAEIRGREGDWVEADAVLAVIEDADLSRIIDRQRLRVREAKLRKEEAGEALARMEGAGNFDDTFTPATAQAVRALQAGLGLPETGTVEPGQAVFTPGAVRIAEHTARVGDAIRGAPVLSYTGTTRLVTVALRVADQALAVVNRQVSVTVPGLGNVEGTISQVDTVVMGSDASAWSFQVTIVINDQEALGPLTAAPVEVDFVSQERENVLAVPVAALLALAEGGYGLEIVEGGATRIVPVKTGMFAAGRVEVSGEGITEGVTMGIPK